MWRIWRRRRFGLEGDPHDHDRTHGATRTGITSTEQPVANIFPPTDLVGDAVKIIDTHATAEPAAVPAHATGRTSGSVFPLSMPARVLLATLSGSAGVIHVVMVPSHAAEWLPLGIAFTTAGWLQIGRALLFVIRPSANLLRVSCSASALFIGAWVTTRVWGMPWGRVPAISKGRRSSTS